MAQIIGDSSVATSALADTALAGGACAGASCSLRMTYVFDSFFKRNEFNILSVHMPLV